MGQGIFLLDAVDGSVQNSDNSSALAQELPQSCAKPSQLSLFIKQGQFSKILSLMPNVLPM